MLWIDWKKSGAKLRIYSNKTAGYHRHILHLPISVKKAFKRFFLEKNIPSPPYFKFWNVENFLIFPKKNLKNRPENCCCCCWEFAALAAGISAPVILK